MNHLGIFRPYPSQVINSCERDLQYINKLNKDADHTIKQLLGVRFWVRTQFLISSGNKLLYYLLTSVAGNQTLGEEYCNIVQTTDFKSVPSFSRRLALAFLYSFDSVLIDRFSLLLQKITTKYGTVNYELQELKANVVCVLNLIKQLNVTVFYLNDSHYELVKRLLGISYLSTTARQSVTSQNEPTFQLLGRISLIQFLLTLYSNYQSFKPNSSKVFQHQTGSKVNPQPDESKCLLCLCKRSNPTLTACGHVFCWDCLHNWLTYKDECPMCRVKVQNNRLIYLYNYC